MNNLENLEHEQINETKQNNRSMENIAARIRELIKDMGISQNEFADRIKTDRSNFSKLLNGKLKISRVLTNKIVVDLSVSKEWLLEGRGEKYKSMYNSGAVIISRDSLKDGAAIGAKVYDIDVTAEQAERDLSFTNEYIIGSINVPFINHDSNIVKVSGDSMSPIIANGDMIAIREVHNFNLIFWGQIYVVILEDYRMVKFVRKHKNPDMVILRSANHNYDDIEISRTEIRSLFVVENIIRFDSRL